jgi:hypothetical protein
MEEETTLKRLMRDNEFLYKKLRVEEKKVRIAMDALEMIKNTMPHSNAPLIAGEAIRQIDRAKYEN